MKALVQSAVAAVTLLACSSLGHSAEQGTEAEAILRKTAKAYEDLRTYRDETTLVVSVTQQGGQERVESRYSLAVERPNKLALVLESGGTGVTLVSDGKRLYTYVPELLRYTVEDAPESLEEFLKDDNQALIMAIGAARILPFFGRDAYKDVMNGVEEVEFVGDEVLERAKTHHIVLHKNESDIDLWVDARDYLLRRVRIDMAKAIKRQKELMPDSPLMTFVIEETHRQIRAGDPIPPDTFVFRPPEGAQQTSSLTGPPESPLIGKKASDFTLEGLQEGTSYRLADDKGKVVMLDFWASWCGPCRYEMPLLQEVYDRYKEKGVTLIAVNAGEDRDTAERFVTAYGLTFPVALDLKGEVSNLYGVTGFPSLILIDRQGIIRKVHVGLAPDLKKQLTQELEMLLAGEAPAGN